MSDALDTAARRRMIHESLCRISSEAKLPIRRIGVPFLIDVVDALEEQGVTVEQSLVLGTFLVGSARAQMREQAAAN